MDRYLSPMLFGANLDELAARSTRPRYSLRTASELGFKEGWLQNAIAHEPELVIAPCREAELTNEQWWFWAREFPVDAGSIDVLLVSESGRVAIVETKLSYNAEKRRSVLAQVLDYAVSLPEEEVDDLPELPAAARVSVNQVERRIQEGDFLLIVAGDQLDSRAVKLGQSLLGDHLVNQWELALVEVSPFEADDKATAPLHLLVPHLRGAVKPELRQLVKVIVEGEKSRVVVEKVNPGESSTPREKWNEGRFFDVLDTNELAPEFKTFGAALRAFKVEYPHVALTWGTGKKTGSATLKRKGNGLVEFYLNGELKFRKDKFAPALGETSAATYLHELRQLFPAEMEMSYPLVRASQAKPRLRELAELLRRVLQQSSM